MIGAVKKPDFSLPSTRHFVVLTCLVIWSLAACAPTEAPDVAEPDVAEEAPEEAAVIRLVLPLISTWNVAVPFYAAMEKGFFEDAGIAIEPIFSGAGGESVQALIVEGDIAVDTGTSAILAAFGQGAELRAVGCSGLGLDGLWVSKGGSPYRSPEDLAGQPVGFTSPGASSQVVVEALARQLEDMGLEPVEPRAVGGLADQVAAVETDQIAAGVIWAPSYLERLEAGELQVVLNAATDIEAYPEDVCVRLHYARAGFVEDHPELVQAFLSAWDRSWEWVYDNREEAAQIWLSSGEDIEIPLSDIVDTFDFWVLGNLRVNAVTGLEHAMEDALRFGLLDERFTADEFEELVDNRHVPGR